MKFDDFLKRNFTFKITRQIDLVSPFFAYENCFLLEIYQFSTLKVPKYAVKATDYFDETYNSAG